MEYSGLLGQYHGCWCLRSLTHWGRATHICVGKLTIIGSDNGLSPGRHQAIIWTNAGILLIRTLGTNFSEILGEIHSFSFSKIHLKMPSAKWRLFGLGLNVLSRQGISRNGIDSIWYATCRVAVLWIWSSSVEQNPRYDTKCVYIFYNPYHNSAC